MVGAAPDVAWDAVRDVGALHTRLVPGFVLATTLEGSVRTVTFANGAVVREPIVTVDAVNRRLVWSTEGGRATHYNAALQVFAADGGSRLVWTIDFLPDAVTPGIDAAMTAAIAAIERTLVA